MSSNKRISIEQGLFFCTIITGEFHALYFNGINFYSFTKQYKKEEIKTFKKIQGGNK